MSAAAVAGAVATMGCPRRNTTNGVKVFKRSSKGIHVSNAAKKNNANKLYKTFLAAKQDRAHKGDKSFVVTLTISKQMYEQLFPNGNVIADLRHDL